MHNANKLIIIFDFISSSPLFFPRLYRGCIFEVAPADARIAHLYRRADAAVPRDVVVRSVIGVRAGPKARTVLGERRHRVLHSLLLRLRRRQIRGAVEFVVGDERVELLYCERLRIGRGSGHILNELIDEGERLLRNLQVVGGRRSERRDLRVDNRLRERGRCGDLERCTGRTGLIPSRLVRRTLLYFRAGPVGGDCSGANCLHNLLPTLILRAAELRDRAGQCPRDRTHDVEVALFDLECRLQVDERGVVDRRLEIL